MRTRITKEQFNKLPQLDRIEFRQREEKINKELDGDLGSWDFLWQMFAVIGFIVIVSLLVYNINSQVTIRLLLIIPLLIKITFGFFVALKILEIVISIKRIKEKRKLQEEYFNFKVEVKKK